MTAEYGMLITVAAIFIPAGLAFLWVVKRDARRNRHDTATQHVTPAGGNIFLDLGLPPDDAARLLAESEKIIAEKRTKKDTEEDK